MGIANQLSTHVADLRSRIDSLRSADDGALHARALWDEHLSLGKECVVAGLAGSISREDWSKLVDSLLACGRLILGMKLDHHFYVPRRT